MTDGPGVVFVLPDKMGGQANITAALLAYRKPDEFRYQVVLTHNHLHTDTRFGGRFPADSQTTIEYTLPIENLHAVMKRVAAAVPPGGGVYVAGDLLDLAVASVYDFGRAVIYMLHGDTDYYYDLAVKHDATVHAFSVCSRQMYERLVERLPHRAATIFHLPYGVPLPALGRRAAPGPLRAIFAGRLEQEQKGVFDLPEIDRRLQQLGVAVSWTIAGSGPDEEELKRRWQFNPRVRWLGALPTPRLLAVYVDQDVFVLPTRFEGFPVGLIEAMSAGVAPVVSRIKSGVPEVIDGGVNGECPPIGDTAAFAAALASLDRDRARLDAMSAAARQTVTERFEIHHRVTAYQALYARWRELYRPLAGVEHLQYGSRLDRPWIPNAVVCAVRRSQRWLRQP